MTAGRPSKYSAAYVDEVIELGKKGKSHAQIASILGVARQTLYNWAEERPEFLDAINRSRDLALAWWEDVGQNMALTGEGNPTAFIFQVKNRFPADYRDKRETEHSGKMEVTKIERTIIKSE